MSDNLPTARSTLPQSGWICLFVWCRACHHQAPTDFLAIIEAGEATCR